MSTDKRPAWHTVVALLGAAVLLTVGVVAASWLHSPGPSCDELTAEMLTMTGPTPTADYDVERVREINATRADQGCTR